MNPLQSIRNALSQRDLERHKTATELYDQLVTDLADDKPREDHEQIENILQGSNRTVDELATDVEGLLERRRLAMQVKSLGKVKCELAELHSRLDASRLKAEKWQKDYEDLQISLRPSIQELESTFAQLNSFNTKLCAANLAAGSRGLKSVEPN